MSIFGTEVFVKMKLNKVLTLDGTTMHPQCRIKEQKFNDANLSESNTEY